LGRREAHTVKPPLIGALLTGVLLAPLAPSGVASPNPIAALVTTADTAPFETRITSPRVNPSCGARGRTPAREV
jgi:hypothetical protein